MKRSRKDVVRKATKIPRLKFEDDRLTSFAGSVVFQRLFHVLQLRKRFSRCLDGQGTGKAFPTARLFLQLIVHLLIGFRELRHADCYRDDPLVQRVLGFEVMPDVATLSRMLKCANAKSVSSLKKLLGDLVLARFIEHPLARITLDFDGSVQSTKRRAQGTAVGYNKKRKGVRSYYPLFCTIAQTGQVLNFLHRAGNVHDSKGARAFVLECVRQVRDVMPGAIIEIRMDSAFFSDEIVPVWSIYYADQQVRGTKDLRSVEFWSLERDPGFTLVGMSSKVNVLGKEQNIERALSMHGLGAFRSLEFARDATSNIDMRWCATAADFRRGGLFDLLQFRIRLARGSWTNRVRIPGRRNCRGGRSLRTSVRVTAWVLERTKLLRRTKPE